MADYQPLIAKAVAGLDKNTGEARRALYERARTALVAQLRGVTPPLSESDITRERLALEEAIRKVEAESARKTRYEPLPRPESRTPARASKEEAVVAQKPAPQPHLQADEALPDAPHEPESKPKPESRAEAPPSPTAAELRRPRPRPSGDRASLSDEGLKGFRDVVAEAETLGEATAQAGKTAREAYASVPPPDSEHERLEPHIEPEGLRPRSRRAPVPEPPKTREADRHEEFGRLPAGPDLPRTRPPVTPEIARGRHASHDRRPDADLDLRPTHLDEFVGDDLDYAERFPAAEGKPGEARPSRRALGRPPGESEVPPRLGSRGRWFKLAAIAGVIGLLAAVIVWQSQPIMTMLSGVTSLFSSPPPPTPTPREAAPSRPKISDRVGDSARSGQSSAVAPVAQRVVLYEEDPSDPAGKQYVGSAVWRNETVAPAPGQPPEMAVRADIEIPDRKITMRWSLRRNVDSALPASHTIEIMFTLPPDFSHGGIQNIPGILMKQAEQTRGVPLSGLAVKVTTNFFLIGLSSVEADMQRNIALLKERAWFDVPVVYNDGRRAILAVEKGNPGERAFQDAFASWAARGK